ncbi:MAG TPA: aminotransferase class III-fold pyridoxal phosphate-dependent enzyme, partial [Solirubrobacterales bacterium]|nr:aminotransferase class III-fold pyridoxal phosphate-dependent enzyme [Solirubrobacterales bacterium]
MTTTAGNLGLEETRALEERYLMRTYGRGAVDFVRGEGALLWDADGNEYLDFLTGISVCSLGHCHPAVVAAVREQTERLMHVSNLFYTEPMARLAQRLSESSLGGRVFFANSGTEANECGIKIARKHARARGVTAPEILSFEGEFHGRSYGALSATPGLARPDSCWPLLPGFRAVPRDDPAAIRAAVGADTAAGLVEPIQGEAGVFPIADEVLM